MKRLVEAKLIKAGEPNPGGDTICREVLEQMAKRFSSCFSPYEEVKRCYVDAEGWLCVEMELEFDESGRPVV